MAKAKAPSKKKASTTEEKEPAQRPLKAAQMGKAYWSGFISFGLVNIPIGIYAAVREKTVRFHLLHDKDGVRIQQRMICPVDNEEVPRAHTIKGYELSSEKNVPITTEEIATVSPKTQKTLELTNFVDIGQIDPMYFDRPFFILPGDHGAKAYQLLLTALEKSKKAAIGKVVIKTKEYIAAVRPVGNVLCLETLHFADEIVSADEVVAKIPHVTTTAAEMNMALQLVESLTTSFSPQKFHDDYREALLALVSKKAKGGEVATTPVAEDDEPEVIDLMAALKKSLTQVKTKRTAAA